MSGVVDNYFQYDKALIVISLNMATQYGPLMQLPSRCSKLPLTCRYSRVLPKTSLNISMAPPTGILKKSTMKRNSLQA